MEVYFHAIFFSQKNFINSSRLLNSSEKILRQLNKVFMMQCQLALWQTLLLRICDFYYAEHLRSFLFIIFQIRFPLNRQNLFFLIADFCFNFNIFKITVSVMQTYTTFTDESSSKPEILQKFKDWFWSICRKMNNQEKQVY